jgi:uroporphyrinogen decarboxylase
MKPLLSVLDGSRVDPPPIWLMRQAGRFLPEYRILRAKVESILSLAYDPKMAAEVTLQPIRRFGFDAAILFSDILVVPDALGCKVSFIDGEGPRLDPIGDPAGVARLAHEINLDRLAPIFDTISRVTRELPNDCTMLGFCGGPWTVASYMVAGRGTPDLAPARLFAYRHPLAFKDLIDRLVVASIAYLSGQLAAGVEAVQIFESFAGAIPRPFLEDWSLGPIRRIGEGVRARFPNAKIIVFAKGVGLGARDIEVATGANAVGIDWSVDPLALRETSYATPLQGNLDPLALVAGGEALERAVRRVMTGFKHVPHVFNLGHGILPETPIENVEKLLQMVRGPIRVSRQARA